ncbi:hypothetical protein QQS45_00025 [Alteriqipengyuania flavescens]|uniref:hypothetical protein n=1 Tax=Alteriqipengyuania flavescens TaxID=3053610 RepID=UPI0025B30838|nr:hypothetical protein [Alteriqipengyuania flavescens]WJY18676.1 hypothetical protein QQW98_00025 [Alteriqipengyuania flavescens]WJY24616.1 hypothetical protein QQS45_00025 [Alteriqipengyuania flavescens]
MADTKKAATKPDTETKASAESQPTQTDEARVRQGGLQIDGFGLPVNSIARARVLGEIEAKADPAAKPKDWTDALTKAAREMTETLYG